MHSTARHKTIMEIKEQTKPKTDQSTASPANYAVFVPAAPSRATRKISKRSKVSGRAFLTKQTAKQGKSQTIAVESLLELKVLSILLAKPVTMDVLEQPPAIRYTDPSGCNRSHTFDFLWMHTDGTRIAVVVKPASKAAKPEFQAELKAIRAALRKDFAHRLILVTDADFTRDEALNAQRLLMFCPHIQPEHAVRLDAVLPTLIYPLSLGEIIDVLNIGAAGFGTLLPALYDGRLVADPSAEFTHATRIDRGGFA
ncbi:hypothetical protein [uncultured Tateyamaria sp.]|uniref:hypothetical protein n=1 Tax=Tateyamaria sp. 1078 TaxID=3417464 RepID=UPI00261B0A2F|nr:hypothetical protein [uncultured Tateyamaria sp.]